MLRLFSLFALSLKCSECIVGYKRGHCIAVLAFVVFDFETCVAGGILVPGELFWRRSCHEKWAPRGKILIDFKLTCIPTLLAAPPPKQYSTPTLIPSATQGIDFVLIVENKQHLTTLPVVSPRNNVFAGKPPVVSRDVVCFLRLIVGYYVSVIFFLSFFLL